jgi:hypothetical protein
MGPHPLVVDDRQVVPKDLIPVFVSCHSFLPPAGIFISVPHPAREHVAVL